MKNKTKKVGKVILIVLACLLLLFAVFQITKILINTFGEKSESGFLASTQNKIQLYEYVNEEYKQSKTEVRGMEVSIYENEYKDGAISYTKIKLKDKIYYVKKGFTTTEKEKIIMEKTVYVRTNAVLYYGTDSSSIVRSLKKGTSLEVTGYHKILKDGSVDMYKVKVNNKEGYIYSKYVVQKEEEALKNYNENGIYDIHKVRGDTYGGGSAANLDYYPSSRVSFSSNKMPENVHALFIHISSVKQIDDYITFAKENNINAFVIDIKEDKVPSYASKVMGEYSKTSYKNAIYTQEDFKTYIQRAVSEGFYVIGRISTFKDHYYATDHPEEAILDTRTSNSFSYNNSYWPSPYSRNVWEYNVSLAKEAVTEIGFHEIQFDFIRFPEQINEYEKNGSVNLRNTYTEEKADAIQQFLMYARDELHRVNAYVSASIPLGSVSTHVTSYGQYFPAISNVVDVVSTKAYPDSFAKNAYGFSDAVWKNPYELLMKWGGDVNMLQKEISSPATIRTFIQAYDATKEPYISYDAGKVADQIRALYDSKLTGGYIAFHPNSSLEKYKEVSAAFKKEYINE